MLHADPERRILHRRICSPRRGQRSARSRLKARIALLLIARQEPVAQGRADPEPPAKLSPVTAFNQGQPHKLPFASHRSPPPVNGIPTYL